MSESTVLALDLGTGGCKASVWDASGHCRWEAFRPYPVHHPRPGWAEHSVRDWFTAVVDCTREMASHGEDIAAVAVSGHSLGCVLLDGHGEPIEDRTPIWSDTRALEEADVVFAELDEVGWYERTGNGFSPPLYPLFKARWYAKHRPDSWRRTATVIGSKDLVNYWLTGVVATDHSYASGSGVYELSRGDYADDLLAAGGLDRRQLPVPVASHEPIGRLTAAIAATVGLPPGIPVYAGAVDNAAMSLGSRGTAEGRIYASLGSSSWMTVTSARPVLDSSLRPYVFAHCIPGYYVSALSTFNSGTSLAWLHELIAPGRGLVELLDEASALPAGADIPVLLPTLGGGTPAEGGSRVRGSIVGLDLSHGRAELVRAMMEGIAFSLSRSLEWLERLVPTNEDLLLSGGGARHDGWNQIYSDIIGRRLIRTAVDQQAAALGAATIALVGLGEWRYGDAERPHEVVRTYVPDEATRPDYVRRRDRFTALQQFNSRP